METTIQVHPDGESLARAGAAEIVAAYSRAVAQNGSFDLVLAGGSTPRGTYEALAEEPFRDAIDWTRVRVFWGDERCVPPAHPDSNYRMAVDVLLSRVPIPETSVHRIQGELQPEGAAELYDRLVRELVPGTPPRFDLVLLGVGTDGHVASLFPRAEDDSAAVAYYPGARVAIPTRAPVPPHDRVSLTLPVLNASREILFLVSGESKAEVLGRVLAERSGRAPATLPAARVRPDEGLLHWRVDRAAAPDL